MVDRLVLEELLEGVVDDLGDRSGVDASVGRPLAAFAMLFSFVLSTKTRP